MESHGALLKLATRLKQAGHHGCTLLLLLQLTSASTESHIADSSP